MKTKFKCKNCRKEFEREQYDIKRGRIKFCSQKCAHKFNFSGENHPRWNGGKTLGSNGLYILIRKPDHPNCDSHGYVRKHHLVIEKYLGRYLKHDEEVHHINGNKRDNKIKNLMLIKNRSTHLKLEHKIGTYKNHLNKLNNYA